MEIKLLSCPLCSEARFPDVAVLRSSLVGVTKKQIRCPVCEDTLVGLDKFTIHLFTHCDLEEGGPAAAEPEPAEPAAQPAPEPPPAQEPARDVRCDICNFAFSDANILEMHKNLLHTNGFSCHLCHKKFKMQGSLMVHMRVAHYGFGSDFRHKAQDDATAADKQAADRSARTYENKQWECEVCLKKFTTKYFLKKHKRLHTGEMPYVCNLCNKSFTFQQSYHKHMLYHSSDKPHVCAECGRAFKELSTLHNHQRIHSGERPFACETCGKTFRQRVSYLVHRRIHTGAMPYKCTSCGKQFRYKVSQRTHKCKAEPPGAVVRHFGDLVQKLLQQKPPEPEDGAGARADLGAGAAARRSPPFTLNWADVVSSAADAADAPGDGGGGGGGGDMFGFASPTLRAAEQLEQLCLAGQGPAGARPADECSTVNEECFRQLLYHSDH